MDDGAHTSTSTYVCGNGVLGRETQLDKQLSGGANYKIKSIFA